MREIGEVEKGVLALTGASAGLGRALALAWAEPGRRMALAARHAEPLEEVATQAERQGARVAFLAGDVGDPSFAAAFVRTARSLGPLTALVTNASSLGSVPLTRIENTPDRAWEQAFTVNLLGTARLWREALPALREAGGGRLLALSSDAAVVPYPTWGPYGAMKAAVDHLVGILAAELEEEGLTTVFAYAVDPGDMDTDMHRQALPDDDPTTLARPSSVAPHLLDLLVRRSPLPSGRYRLEELDAGAPRA